MHIQLIHQLTTTITPFIKYGFPIMMMLGCGVLFYYGYKGIVKKETVNLTKFRGFSVRESQELTGGSKITGNSAMVSGIMYIIMGIFLLGVFGFTYWYDVF